MRVPLLLLTALILAACTTTQLPISPHKIDVQQGNVIDQEALEKLKPGLTRSQVRFLLGTPLLIDPFRDNRWDYVYNYRNAGTLTAQKRLTIFFDHDVLNRIETSGLDQPTAALAPAVNTSKAQPAQAAPEVKSATGTELTVSPPAAAAAIEPPQTAPDNKAVEESHVQPMSATVQATQPAPQATARAPAKRARRAATSTGQSRVKTSVVPPLAATPATSRPTKVENSSPQSLILRRETDVASLKPDVMPESPQTTAVSEVEAPVLAAAQAWAKAWSDRDEEAYLAAYASDFKPTGGFGKAEWERRRRLLLNLSKKIEVRIESPEVEFPAEDRALITFNQYYRSATYHDTVVKQLLMGLQDGRWLILEEKVLPVLPGRNKK
ncbi:MAG: outer membrane protein assembly factor BamE [Thiobacillaceae bacterium]